MNERKLQDIRKSKEKENKYNYKSEWQKNLKEIIRNIYITRKMNDRKTKEILRYITIRKYK